MIQKFEDELDVKVFDRTTHPIRTTDVGLQIIDQAKVIIESVNELKNKANLLNNILGGTINIWNHSYRFFFHSAYGNLQIFEENPKIQMNVKEMTTDNIIKALKAGNWMPELFLLLMMRLMNFIRISFQ
jgi:LysR family hydrogen peroxide-inducible transcriptional activator